MDKNRKKLMKKALCGESVACRKLGLGFWKGKGCKKDKELARIFLEKAMELGDEKGYFAYHRLFSKGKQVIDDGSYAEMHREYLSTWDGKRKKKLQKYLEPGTKEQQSGRAKNIGIQL